MLIVKFRGLIDKIIQVLSTIIMGVMVIAVCWQVITRYILNNPSTVTEDAALSVDLGDHGGRCLRIRPPQASGHHRAEQASVLQGPEDSGYLCAGYGHPVLRCYHDRRRHAAGPHRCRPAQRCFAAAHALIYASVPVGAILFIFYALIFIGEDLRDMRAGRPEPEAAKEA